MLSPATMGRVCDERGDGMGLSGTPASERVHIGFFGMRNAGKSSVVNAVTGQDLAVVSATAGTTTDPVRKTMELLPLGPVLVIDTPGVDDEGALGNLRVERTRRVLAETDIAVLVVDAMVGLRQADRDLLALFDERGIPHVTAFNKADLPGARLEDTGTEGGPAHADLLVSARTGQGVFELKEAIAHLRPQGVERRPIADLLAPGDQVVFVIPIDSAAPKGRLILPEQMCIRDALEAAALVSVCRETELAAALDALRTPPALVVTDSQAFEEVARVVPEDVSLTSFSILMSRYKGRLAAQVAGAEGLDRLHDGDVVLISEGCTHHRQCEDIGTVKMPAWIRRYTGVEPTFRFTSGGEFPADLSGVSLVVHCGGCMLNAREMQSLVDQAAAQGVPIVNYGVAIAKMKGILGRALAPVGM